MLRPVRGASLALFFAVALTPNLAFADSSPAADALFRAGREAYVHGDFPEAAARFAESQRLDPAPGTLLNLALAEEKMNRLALAWEHARAAEAQLSPRDERWRLAQELFARVDTKLPRLTLTHDSALPDDAVVVLDGQELRAASFGIALPADPGVHRVVVRAKGHLDRDIEIRLAEGAVWTERIEPGAATMPSRTAMAATPAENTSSHRGPGRTLGFVGLGASGAAVVTGAVFGVLALDRSRVSDAHCTGGCDDLGLDAQRSGRTFAAISTASLIGGGVMAIAGGIALFVTRDTP